MSCVRVTGLWVHLRIARHFDVKETVAFAADELHQLAGVAEVAVAGHARGQVAAQRDDALAAHRLVLVEQLADFRARAAHARQVRRGVQAVRIAQVAHDLRRVRQRRTARAEGDADVVGLERLQFRQRRFERGFLLVGLGRKEFEADRRHRGQWAAGVAAVYLFVAMKRYLRGRSGAQLRAGVSQVSASCRNVRC